MPTLSQILVRLMAHGAFRLPSPESSEAEA